MSTRRIAPRSARAALGLAAVAAVVSLSGCLPPGGGEPSGSPSTPSESAPPATGGPTSSPSETAPPAESPTPVSIPCSSVVDPQTMYDFNPNFGLLASFTPDSGSLAEQAVADQGTVCRWINQTSGDTIDVTISQPGPTAFAQARSSAGTGTPVSGLGDAAYFSASGGPGVVQSFSGPFWITATSVFFTVPDDASGIVRDAVAAAR